MRLPRDLSGDDLARVLGNLGYVGRHWLGGCLVGNVSKKGSLELRHHQIPAFGEAFRALSVRS
jgi:hypothetical protein